jgi:hypothetical protein
MVSTLPQLGFSSKRKSYQPPEQLRNVCPEPGLPFPIPAGHSMDLKIESGIPGGALGGGCTPGAFHMA